MDLALDEESLRQSLQQVRVRARVRVGVRVRGLGLGLGLGLGSGLGFGPGQPYHSLTVRSMLAVASSHGRVGEKSTLYIFLSCRLKRALVRVRVRV